MDDALFSYIEDLGGKPVLPIDGKDFDNGGDEHEDLHHPHSGLTTELVNRPTADEENDNESTSISSWGSMLAGSL